MCDWRAPTPTGPGLIILPPPMPWTLISGGRGCTAPQGARWRPGRAPYGERSPAVSLSWAVVGRGEPQAPRDAWHSRGHPPSTW